MSVGREYIVQFVGLNLGQHEFEFLVNDKFFEHLDYSEIKQGKIKITLTLIKQSTMMVLEFNVSGTVKVNCDLCSVDFDLPISGDYRLIVKVGGHEVGDEDDDIISIAANEHELDLSQFIYEYIMLSIPLKRVHPDNEKGESTCDKLMLKKISQFLTDKPTEETNDPRWDGLKNIKLN